LNLQSLDALEFSNVVGDKDSVNSESLGGDEQIVGADWRSRLLELGADSAVVPIGFRFEWKDLKSIQHLIYAAGQDSRPAFCYAVTEFSGNNNACCDGVAFDGREGRNLSGDFALRILQEFGQDVGVEEILGGH